MDPFDICRDWVILAPLPAPAAAEDLARLITTLRERDGLGRAVPAILDADGPAPEASVPIIVLNMEQSSDERGGYSWRIGQGRVEIYGDSRRGLCNGIYSFLAALGFRWPAPAQESLPPAPTSAPAPIPAGSASTGPGIYPLKVPGVYVRSTPAPENRRRLVISPRVPNREIPALGQWAARNRVDALVFSLRDRRFRRATKSSRLLENLEKNWGLIVERGGSDLSFLVPRRYFLLKRDLFRMEGGKRKGDHHFCPTSPDTIKLLQSRAAALLDQPGFRHGGIYHLWPDRGAEHLWCACPACRAFSPREQIRLAVNTVAVVIAEKDPQAFVSCREQETKADEQLPGGSELSLRSNVFTLQTGTPPDGGGLLLYTYERGVIGEL